MRKTKKYIYIQSALFLIVFLFIVSKNSFSQSYLGIRSGLNFTTLVYEDAQKEALIKDARKVKFDLHVGFVLRYHLNKIMFVQPELNYSRKGMKYIKAGQNEGKNQLNYLDLPIMAGIKVWHKRYSAIEIGLGPYGGFWLDGKNSFSSYKNGAQTSVKVNFADSTVKYNRWDAGVFVETAYEITHPDFSWVFSLRYQHGMLANSQETADAVRNRVLSLSVAYLFKL